MVSFYEKMMTKQKMMRTVLIALLPILLYATYLYGLRVLALTLVNILVAVAVEYISETKIFKRKKVSEAALVSAVLYTMTLPPAVSFWISALGIAFAIFFGKMVFGGFGRNVFNPAIVGRAFIYINFPQPLTIQWNSVAQGRLGGFTTWLSPIIDEASTATPMLLFRNAGQTTPLQNLFIGNISGSIGETSALLIILAGIYLIYKKVASWEIMAATLMGFALASLGFNLAGVEAVSDPIFTLLSGGALFGSVFMATDPISAPRQQASKWIYGILIGLVAVIIRSFALFSGGMMFAILMGNTFAPIVDYVIAKRKKAKAQAKKEVSA